MEINQEIYICPPGHGKRPLNGKEGEQELGAVEEGKCADQRIGDPHHHSKGRDQPPGGETAKCGSRALFAPVVPQANVSVSIRAFLDDPPHSGGGGGPPSRLKKNRLLAAKRMLADPPLVGSEPAKK